VGARLELAEPSDLSITSDAVFLGGTLASLARGEAGLTQEEVGRTLEYDQTTVRRARCSGC